MQREFDGMDVVITGGTGALGCALAGLLVEQGAAVHIPVFLRREADGFPFRDHERVRLTVSVDLRDERAAVEYYRGLPALSASVHVAGGFDMAPIDEMSLEHFRSQFELNTVTCFLCCREAVRRFRQDGPGDGRIVNVAARPAVLPAGGMIGYSTAKAGVATLTQCLADEVKEDGILVNAVLPSIMDTPANRSAMPDADFGAWPKVDEVARAIAFLASPSNRLTSGALVPVYGRA